MFASLMGWILFEEIPGMLTVIGGTVIIAAIICYSRVEE